MSDAGVAWAERVLGRRVVHSARLTGGLTSTMLVLGDDGGGRSVLRLMTQEPWRAHGAALTRRERAAQQVLAPTSVPAPTSLGIDPDGDEAGVSAHLMTLVAGSRRDAVGAAHVWPMARMLALIHAVVPDEPFREYQSWAGEEKRVVPAWSARPDAWRRAFAVLDDAPPAYRPALLHRDFSHRNLLWRETEVVGVVDWVETSTGPAWLDVAHASTNLAMAAGIRAAQAMVDAYAELSGTRPDPYWLVMDAVGFLPSPGHAPMFGSEAELAGLDAWIGHVVECDMSREQGS